MRALVFTDADSSQNMDDEMNAMRQMFVRLSEKKKKEEKQRVTDYKRAYINAFKNDVCKRFDKAKRERKECMKRVKDQIHAYQEDVNTINTNLVESHQVYIQNYQLSIENVRHELKKWKELSHHVQLSYDSILECCNKQFDQFERQLEHMLTKTQVKMIQAAQDKSYLSSFRPQVKRLAS